MPYPGPSPCKPVSTRRRAGFHSAQTGYTLDMTSLTKDLPTAQIVDRLHDLVPPVPDITPLLEATEPVVERVNEALGRSSSRSAWRWVVLGALGAVGIVAVVVIVKRRRVESEGVTAPEQSVPLAS